jgi:hypothetical protein
MRLEFFGLLLIIILYWFFNIRDQDYISIPVPAEKMSNVSIFDGNL